MTNQRYYALLESSNGERFMYGSILQPTVKEALWRHNNNWQDAPFYAEGWTEAHTFVIETREKIDGEWQTVQTVKYELPEPVAETSYHREITEADLQQDLADYIHERGIQI